MSEVKELRLEKKLTQASGRIWLEFRLGHINHMKMIRIKRGQSNMPTFWIDLRL